MKHIFKDDLRLSADSIAAVPAGFKGCELIVFNPDPETKVLLEKMNIADNSNVIYHKITLIDKWDNGSTDTHVSNTAQVLRCIHDSGKSKTWLLTIRYL